VPGSTVPVGLVQVELPAGTKLAFSRIELQFRQPSDLGSKGQTAVCGGKGRTSPEQWRLS